MLVRAPTGCDKYVAILSFVPVCGELLLVGEDWVVRLVAVLNAAPIVFGPMADFRYICKEAVNIATISTVEFVE